MCLSKLAVGIEPLRTRTRGPLPGLCGCGFSVVAPAPEHLAVRPRIPGRGQEALWPDSLPTQRPRPSVGKALTQVTQQGWS